MEGYRLIEGAFHRNLQVYDYFCIDCGNEATGFTVFTCQCIVSYFSIRHSPEQRYRLSPFALDVYTSCPHEFIALEYGK